PAGCRRRGEGGARPRRQGAARQGCPEGFEFSGGGCELSRDGRNAAIVEQGGDRAGRLVEQLCQQRTQRARLGDRIDADETLQAVEPGHELLDLVERLSRELRQLVELVEAGRVGAVGGGQDAGQLRAAYSTEPGAGVERAARGRREIARYWPGDP